MQKEYYEIHHLSDKAVPAILMRSQYTPSRMPGANLHENPEVLYCTEGTGQLICEGVRYPVQAGDILVVNCNELHDLSTDTCLNYVYLIIDSDFLAANGLSPDTMVFEHVVRSEAAASLFRQIMVEYETQQPCRALLLRGLLLQLMACLARTHGRSREKTDVYLRKSTEHVKLIVNYIKLHYSEKLTLDRLSAEVGLSKYHFVRLFKQVTGATVLEYLNVIRCQKAWQMLMRREATVAETALRCGYESSSYFSKIFRKIMGCLPSEVSAAADTGEKTKNYYLPDYS